MKTLYKALAVILSGIALAIASISTSLCILGVMYEPQMPKSLYLKK